MSSFRQGKRPHYELFGEWTAALEAYKSIIREYAPKEYENDCTSFVNKLDSVRQIFDSQ
jgi:hypothetical protein